MIEKHTEKSMLKAVHNYFSTGYKYCIKNSFIFRYDWESDYFCINREGYAFEVEVKISKADFRNDIKKEKHKLFGENLNNRLLPNKFYYAVPKGLIDEKDVPKYAGLIIVDGTHAIIQKRAPFIHKKKYDFRKILCDKFYFQWLNQKKNARHMEYEFEGLKKTIENLSIFRFTAEGKTWSIKTVDFETRTVIGKSEFYYDRKTRNYNNETIIKTFKLGEVKFK